MPAAHGTLFWHALGAAALLAACAPPPTVPPDASPVPDAGPSATPDAGPLPDPVIGAVLPTTGEAGTAFEITGHHFVAGVQVFFGAALAADALAAADGTLVTGTVPPKNEADPALVTVRVRNPDGAEAVVADAFTYGTVEVVQWCTLVAPLEHAIWQDGAMPLLTGQAYHPEVTEGLGRNGRLGGQVGVGRADQAPADWTWSWTEWTADEGNDDRFGGTPARPGIGEWRWAYRFTLGGGRWVYCDSDGSDNGFDPAAAGRLVVRRRPFLGSLSPAHARAGATVTVTGLGLSAAGTFRFGALDATSADVEPTGNLARLVAPRGLGTVDVSFTLDGATATLPAAFTWDLDPNEIAISGFSPAFLSVGGGTLTLAGANFAEPVTVLVGGVAATVTSSTADTIVAEVPAVPPGRHAIEVTSNGRTGAPAEPLVIHARRAITVDGTLDPAEWLPELRVAEDATNSDWANNDLRELYVAYDDAALYVAVRGRVEASNAIVGYLSSSQLTTGSSDVSRLGDGSGALDDQLSSPFEAMVAGFRAQYGFGLVGDAPAAVDGLDDRAGLRELSCAGCAGNFAHSVSTVRRGDGVVEFAFPWSTGEAGEPPNLFVPFPTAGATFQLFLRIVGNGGQLFPNQSLPADPNAVAMSNGFADAQQRRLVSQVASVDVR